MLQRIILVFLLTETTFLQCEGMLYTARAGQGGLAFGTPPGYNPWMSQSPLLGHARLMGLGTGHPLFGGHPMVSPPFGPRNPLMGGFGVETVYEPRRDGSFKPVTRYHMPDGSVTTRNPAERHHGRRHRQKPISPSELPKRKHQEPLPIEPYNDDNEDYGHGQKYPKRRGQPEYGHQRQQPNENGTHTPHRHHRSPQNQAPQDQLPKRKVSGSKPQYLPNQPQQVSNNNGYQQPKLPQQHTKPPYSALPKQHHGALPKQPYAGQLPSSQNSMKKKPGQESTPQEPISDETSYETDTMTPQMVNEMQQALETDPDYRKKIRDAYQKDPQLKQLIDQNPGLKQALKGSGGSGAPNNMKPQQLTGNPQKKNKTGNQVNPSPDDDRAQAVYQMQQAIENDPDYRNQIKEAYDTDPELKQFIDQNPGLKQALKGSGGSGAPNNMKPQQLTGNPQKKNKTGNQVNPSPDDERAQAVYQMQQAIENDPDYRNQIKEAYDTDPELKQFIDQNPGLKQALKGSGGSGAPNNMKPQQLTGNPQKKNKTGNQVNPSPDDERAQAVYQMQQAIENDPDYRKQLKEAYKTDPELKQFIDQNPGLKNALFGKSSTQPQYQAAPENSEEEDGEPTDEEMAQFVQEMRQNLEQDPNYRQQIRTAIQTNQELNDLIQQNPELKKALNKR